MKKAFTLVELFIIIAIIAILSAIAVPNFLEARTHKNVSQLQKDTRAVFAALAAYKMDWDVYPYDGYNYPGSGSTNPPASYNYWYLPYTISTPVAYLPTCRVIDPWRPPPSEYGGHWQYQDIRYRSTGSTYGTDFDSAFGGQPPAGYSSYYDEIMHEFGEFLITIVGPDRAYGPGGWQGVSNFPSNSLTIPYDPTNGSISLGDILHSHANPEKGYTNIN